MKEVPRLTREESHKIVVHVVKKVFKKMSNEVNGQLKILSAKYENIQSEDFIDIALRILTSLDVSVIIKIVRDHKTITGNNLDVERIFQLYVNNLYEIVKEEKVKLIKEGMN